VPLLVGSMAILAVAILVVAMTPTPDGGGGQAITGSTAPSTAAGGARPVASTNGVASVRLSSFTPIPNAVAAMPQFSLDDQAFAARLPRRDETVIVQTELATYLLGWGDVQYLDLDGNALIADASLALVGYLDDGQFYSLVTD
jgi:hypothetical protein